MVVSGEAMAAGPEVRGNHAERPGTVGLRRAFSTGVPSGVIVDEFVDSVLEPDRGVGTDPAGEDDDRYVVVACELRGTDRSLASDGLGVDAAFSREHPISARDGVL